MLRRILIIAVLLAMLAIPVSLFAQDSDVLRVASTATVTTWDPSLSFSTEALYMANLYEPLLWVNSPDSEEPFRPALATEWETSEDGMTWTFHLREGVKFHDGSSFDANDVVTSLALQWDAAHPLHTGNTGGFTYWTSLWGGFLNPPAQ
jgi:peptide/nickel transport system substrate-binding protein